jgi:hypothetical protein
MCFAAFAFFKGLLKQHCAYAHTVCRAALKRTGIYLYYNKIKKK